MVAIPGFVFIIVGAILSGTSFFVNRSQQSNSLTVFIYIGYLFIAYGVAKILIGFILNKKGTKKSSQQNARQDSSQYPHRHPQQQSHQNSVARSTSSSYNVSSARQGTNPQREGSVSGVQAPRQAHTPPTPGYVGRCTHCSTPMRAVNVYCHRCGTKQPAFHHASAQHSSQTQHVHRAQQAAQHYPQKTAHQGSTPQAQHSFANTQRLHELHQQQIHR